MSHNVDDALLIDTVTERVRLACRLRRAWVHHITDAGGNVDWTRDSVTAQVAFVDGRAELKELANLLDEATTTLTRDADSALSRVRSLFGLSAVHVDLLHLAIARAVHPALGRSYQALNPWFASHASPDLTASLFGHMLPSPWHDGSPLAVWELLTPVRSDTHHITEFRIDPTILGFVHGTDACLEGLDGICHIPAPTTPLSCWPVARVQAALEVHQATSTTVVVRGRPGSGRRSFAAHINLWLSRQSLGVNTAAVDLDHWPRLYRQVLRATRLHSLIPIWHGPRVNGPWPSRPGRGLLEWLILPSDEPPPPHATLTVDLPAPAGSDRRKLWREHVAPFREWPEPDRDALTQTHGLLPADIVAIGERAPQSVDQAQNLCRERTQRHLDGIGQRLDNRFSFDDLVVDDALRRSLEELIYEARHRRVFWEIPAAQRLFPRGRGVTSLFAGPPGTGKTMAAQVVASELGLDLVRVDVASTVSKYIGETAKNLRRIFTRASPLDAVLLFDEADALFARRTDVKDSHDRHANANTNYLLQLLEDFPGVAILATNKRGNIDGAFVRRLRYILQFTRPGAQLRLKISRHIVREFLGGQLPPTLETTLEALSELAMSGAQLKSCLLSAALLARHDGGQISPTHIIRGVERELAKEGRAFGQREKRRLRGAV